MAAFEMVGKMQFYLGNIKKADYYHDRYLRGKFEIVNSKVRTIADTVYIRKMRMRDDKFLTFEEIRKKEDNLNKKGQNAKIEKAVSNY